MGKYLDKLRKQEKKYLATCTLNPSSLHIYNVPEGGYNRTHRFEANKVNLKNNKHKGELSDKAVKRVKNAIEWLLIRSKPQPVFNRQADKVFFFRLNFITLTLPSKQIHSDHVITSRCLQNFLNILRNQAGVDSYLWKAEAQVNGNIHYHITTNQFIHWSDVRKWWCSSIELLGYVSRFKAKFHHSNPPCSEIKKVKHIRKLASYLSKYMAKNKSFAPIGELREINGKRIQVLYTSKVYRDEKSNMKAGKVVGSVLCSYSDELKPLRKIESNLWGCSRDISSCKSLKFDVSCLQWHGIQRIIKSGRCKLVKNDYTDSYYGDMLKLSRELSAGLYEDMINNAYMRDVELNNSDANVLRYLDTILELELQSSK